MLSLGSLLSSTMPSWLSSTFTAPSAASGGSSAASSKADDTTSPTLVSEIGLTARASVQIINAHEVKAIHDRVEAVAYRAFAEAVVSLGLKSDPITSEQSSAILQRVKIEAHREMFKKEGYISSRGTLLELSQVEKVIQSIGRIVHDRDHKLTFATGRYSSLTDLLLALDDHNTMVKEILISSWFKDESFKDPEHHHLSVIKSGIDFYPTLSRTLSFDIESTLKDRKTFWDTHFPHARKDGPGLSEAFLQIQEVRSTLELALDGEFINLYVKTTLGRREVGIVDRDKTVASYLLEAELELIFNKRSFDNPILRSAHLAPALLSDSDITVEQLLQTYFPEIAPKKA